MKTTNKPKTCACGHSRGRHITPIHGKPLGRCYAGGCKCREFLEVGAERRRTEPQLSQVKRSGDGAGR